MPTQEQIRRQRAFWRSLHPVQKDKLIAYGEFETYYKTRNEIGFRVIALDGSHANFNGLTARNPQAAPTGQSLYGQLNGWDRWGFQTPWVSTSTSWNATVWRVERLKAAGATRVFIVLFDMETAGPAIDAARFAYAYRIAEWQRYRYEWVCDGQVPWESVITVIDASSKFENVEIHLATLRVPKDLLELATAEESRLSVDLTPDTGSRRSDAALWRWLLEVVYPYTGVADHGWALRLVQAMCTERLDSWHAGDYLPS